MKGSLKSILVAAAALLVCAGVALALTNPFSRVEKVRDTNGVVAVPVSKVGGSASFYRFDDGGKEIKFFLVKGNDGSIRAAFDACDACYREKKGYVQQGDFMVCRNCNMKFAIARLGKSNTGGCNPGYLPYTTDGGSVMIKTSDLRGGAHYF